MIVKFALYKDETQNGGIHLNSSSIYVVKSINYTLVGWLTKSCFTQKNKKWVI